MTAEEFKKHHATLDERLIGYSASFEESHYSVSFQGGVVVKESEAALRRRLEENASGKPAAFQPFHYGSVMETLHINGVSLFMDRTSSGRFREAMAEDLRFVGDLKQRESALGVLVEPVYDPCGDSAALLKPQIEEAVVGYYDKSNATDCVQLYGRIEDCCNVDHSTRTEIAAIRWHRFRDLRLKGMQFRTDEIVQQRVEELLGLERFCVDTLADEAQYLGKLVDNARPAMTPSE